MVHRRWQSRMFPNSDGTQIWTGEAPAEPPLSGQRCETLLVFLPRDADRCSNRRRHAAQPELRPPDMTCCQILKAMAPNPDYRAMWSLSALRGAQLFHTWSCQTNDRSAICRTARCGLELTEKGCRDRPEGLFRGRSCFSGDCEVPASGCGNQKVAKTLGKMAA